jgi:hypothetical protein
MKYFDFIKIFVFFLLKQKNYLKSVMFNYLYASRFIAKVSTSLFAGNAIYVSLVEHPARLSCGTSLAATVFPASFYKAAKLQVSLILLGTAGALTSYCIKPEDTRWLVAGVMLFISLPYTFAVMKPTLNKLLSDNIDKEAEETRSNLVRWGKMHAVRSILSTVAMLIMLS